MSAPPDGDPRIDDLGAEAGDPRRPPGGPHDQRRPGVATLARTAGPERTPIVLVVVIAVFFGLATVKPWAGAAAPRPTFVPDTPSPIATPTVDPLAGIRADCQDPAGWRIFSRERWTGGTLRSWRSIEPVGAQLLAIDPLDPAIPVIPIPAAVEALGYCAPWAGPERPPDSVRVRIWAISTRPHASGEPAVRTIAEVEAASASSTLGPPLGVLDAPAVRPGEVPGDLWLPGTYIWSVEGGGFRRAWAVAISDLGPVSSSGVPPAGSPVP